MRNLYWCAFILMIMSCFYLGGHYNPEVPFKPNFAAISPLALRQQVFIGFMVPKINMANQQILETRNHIIELALVLEQGDGLSYADHAWLKSIAYIYQVPNFSDKNPKTMVALLERVDTVPISLVLAQASNESAWGASRFAVEADNFFGQYCYVEGCGIVPRQRPNGEIYELQKFKNVQAAINEYLYNLNTNASYAHFRAARAAMRWQKQPLLGYELAQGLVNYSILGLQYVSIIQSIIVSHGLTQYDQE